jgi:hypothetical protein
MTEARFQFWRKWLPWANVITIGMGLLVAFAGNAIFFVTHNAYSEQVLSLGGGILSGGTRT